MTPAGPEPRSHAMKSFPLVRHPSTPCAAVRGIDVALAWSPDGRLVLKYSVEGEISRLRLPDPVLPARTDGLWRRTCFEVFLRSEGTPAYDEFNFAPSGDWAHYHFTGYREGMVAPEATPPPEISLVRAVRHLELEARLEPPRAPIGPGDRGLRLGLTAVIEQDDGSLAYWALAHLLGKPDFHHAAGFALSLPHPSP